MAEPGPDGGWVKCGACLFTGLFPCPVSWARSCFCFRACRAAAVLGDVGLFAAAMLP